MDTQGGTIQINLAKSIALYNNIPLVISWPTKDS